MPRLTPLVMGVLVVLLAGCAPAAIDQPTAPASVSATSSSSPGPDSPSPSPSQAPTAASDSLPSPPTDVVAKRDDPAKPWQPFPVHLSWTRAAQSDAYRIYEYQTGAGPGYGKCLFDRAMASLILETQPGATSADVTIVPATGAGVRCLYILALNAAGESAPTLAWRSESG